jgi:hypothetical protein
MLEPALLQLFGGARPRLDTGAFGVDQPLDELALLLARQIGAVLGNEPLRRVLVAA